MMKKCIKCGAQLDDDSRFCTKCGYNLKEENTDTNTQSNLKTPEQIAAQPDEIITKNTDNTATTPQDTANILYTTDKQQNNGGQNLFDSTYQRYSKKAGQNDAVASMTCGIIAVVMGLLCMTDILFFYLAAIVLGIVAIVKSKAGLKEKNAKAVSGLILGIVALALVVIIFIVLFTIGLMEGLENLDEYLYILL